MTRASNTPAGFASLIISSFPPPPLLLRSLTDSKLAMLKALGVAQPCLRINLEETSFFLRP